MGLKRTKISCVECDSELEIECHPSNVSGPIKFCPICGEDLEKNESPIDEDVFPDVSDLGLFEEDEEEN